MVRFSVRFATWIHERVTDAFASLARREEGQASAEYALVILAAAAVALVLIAWAKSSGKLPAFFDKVIDDLTGSFV
jgi:Flp pilus assembly pilin Flp